MPTAFVEDDKVSVTHDDVVQDLKADGVDRHLATQVPEILRGLSEEEIAAIDKSTTRKLDILLMPTLVSLYILCVAPAQSSRHERLTPWAGTTSTDRTSRPLSSPTSLATSV